MQYTMFLVMRDIAARAPPSWPQVLCEQLGAEAETYAGNDRFRLHGMNGRQIHRLLPA